MKRAIFAFVVVGLTIGLAGCVSQGGRGSSCGLGGGCQGGPEGCASCDGSACDPGDGWDDDWGDPGCRTRREQRARAEREAAAAGPATGAVTYPYYTLRGPRDFLARDYPRLGP
jgi:hypothetical protein